MSENISRFLTNMSHEIRTPVNAVLEYTALLKERIKGEEEASYLKSIEKAGTNLMNLITDILDLSKIESGRMKIQKEFIDVYKLFEDIKDIFSLKVKEKAISLDLLIDPSIPRVLLLDEMRVRQVLFNLVGNAVKFTEKGHVTISAKAEFLAGDTKKAYISIDVKDTGIGISKEEQEEIFEPFSQNHDKSDRALGSTGLGLSITKRLVEMMGGIITLESKLGEGSLFSVRIPDIVIGSETEAEVADLISKSQTDNHDKEGSDKAPYLNEILIKKLDLLYKGIWKECNKSHRRADVKEFARQLWELGEIFNVKEINKYSKHLYDAAVSFNTERIKELLGEFPQMLEAFQS
ncbi:MAG: hypothetical protein GX236_12235 [Clostridiaceae bacterium]|jgi:two-component system sensor histidine kinase EvgS|nr:hypothetical protein [Clostridiaceae bacterium]